MNVRIFVQKFEMRRLLVINDLSFMLDRMELNLMVACIFTKLLEDFIHLLLLYDHLFFELDNRHARVLLFSFFHNFLAFVILVRLWAMKVEFLAYKAILVLYRHCTMVARDVKLRNVGERRQIIRDLRVQRNRHMAINFSVVRHSMKHTVTINEVVTTLILMKLSFIHRLHLDYKIAVVSEHLLRVEDATVGLKSTTRLMPPAAIESVEVVFPEEFELVLVLVVSENLDVVVHDVPGHVRRVEAFAP